MEQQISGSTSTTYNCPSCHIIVRQSDYFCFNCGKNLKPAPLNISIWKQILLYGGSIVLAPFGVIWGFRYLRDANPKAKIVGIVCIVLTLITLTAVTIYSINLINKVQDEVHKQLQMYNY